MKKLIYGLVISSMIGSSCSAFSFKDKAKGVWGNVKGHKVAYGLGTTSVLIAGLASYDIIKNDAKVLTRMGLISIFEIKEIAKKYPKIAAAIIATVIAGGAIGSEVVLKGDNSFIKKNSKAGYNKISALFSKKANNQQTDDDDSQEEDDQKDNDDS
ncbi:hypothetical protein ACFLYH_03335 [Candidatus Dependentiae bacterium]